MSDYLPSLQDMLFVLRELAPLDTINRLPGCEDATPDLAAAILAEAGKFATGVLSPLNASGDREDDLASASIHSATRRTSAR